MLEHAQAGLLLIDMSTIRPETSRRGRRSGSGRKGIRALDAPVSGGEKGAIDGILSIMVGGRGRGRSRPPRPILEVLGKTIVHVGPRGAGQTVKAANQLVVGGIYALVAEAIVLLEASGVDPNAGLDVLAGGLAGSRILDLKRQSMVARRVRPGLPHRPAPQGHGHRDSPPHGRPGVALPVTGLVAQLIAAARAQGHGSLDHSALLKVIENVSGRARMKRIPCMEAVVAVLESEGVDTVFGIPGAAILPLYAALQNSGIEHLTVRHEEGGTHAADGWARATGNVGVCIGTSGPAGTNMITGLYTALADSIPMICITGQAARGQAAPGVVPGGRHRRDRQAGDQVGGAAQGARPGAVGVPRGVPDRPVGPAGPGAHRPADRRAARHLPVRPGDRRAAAGRRAASPGREPVRARDATCCWPRSDR